MEPSSPTARIDCDLVVTATGWTAPTSLLNMAGDRPVYDRPRRGSFRLSFRDNVMVAGSMAGDGSTDERSRRDGPEARRTVGRSWLSRPGQHRGGHRADATGRDRTRAAHLELFVTTHGMVDFNEDVSSKDIFAASEEGYDSVELVKRYTTVTMGPNQGKLETVNAVAVLGEAGPDHRRGGHHSLATPLCTRHPRRSGGGAGIRCVGHPCRVGMKHMAPCHWWPANGSGPTITATPAPKSSTFARESASSTSPPRQARPARPRCPQTAQPGLCQQVVQAESAASVTG